MCDYYPKCDHDKVSVCSECNKPMTLDAHGETTMVALDGSGVCMYCQRADE